MLFSVNCNRSESFNIASLILNIPQPQWEGKFYVNCNRSESFNIASLILNIPQPQWEGKFYVTWGEKNHH